MSFVGRLDSAVTALIQNRSVGLAEYLLAPGAFFFGWTGVFAGIVPFLFFIVRPPIHTSSVFSSTPQPNSCQECADLERVLLCGCQRARRPPEGHPAPPACCIRWYKRSTVYADIRSSISGYVWPIAALLQQLLQPRYNCNEGHQAFL